MPMRTRGRKKPVGILAGSKPQKADSRKRTGGTSPIVHLAPPIVLRQSARERRFYASDLLGFIDHWTKSPTFLDRHRSMALPSLEHDCVHQLCESAWAGQRKCRFACGLLAQ